MLRKITKDIGRFEAGNKHDFARGIWTKIAADLMSEQSARERFEVSLKRDLARELTDADRDAAEPKFQAFLDAHRARLAAGKEKGPSEREVQAFLKSFSEPIDFNPAEQSTTRGNVRVRNRLGTDTRQALR